MFFEFYLDQNHVFRPIRETFVHTCAFYERMHGGGDTTTGIPIYYFRDVKDDRDRFKTLVVDQLSHCYPVRLRVSDDHQAATVFLQRPSCKGDECYMSYLCTPYNKGAHAIDSTIVSFSLSESIEDIFELYNKFKSNWALRARDPSTQVKVDLYLKFKEMGRSSSYVLNYSYEAERDKKPIPDSLTLIYEYNCFRKSRAMYYATLTVNELIRRTYLDVEHHITDKDMVHQVYEIKDNGSKIIEDLRRKAYDTERHRDS